VTVIIATLRNDANKAEQLHPNIEHLEETGLIQGGDEAFALQSAFGRILSLQQAQYEPPQRGQGFGSVILAGAS
jgi:hypothetical protein